MTSGTRVWLNSGETVCKNKAYDPLKGENIGRGSGMTSVKLWIYLADGIDCMQWKT